MKKAIVIQDSNGHLHVVEYDMDTIRMLLHFLVESNKVNTILESEPPPDLKLNEIESWILENCCVGRSGGNFIDIVEVKTDFNGIPIG